MKRRDAGSVRCEAYAEIALPMHTWGVVTTSVLASITVKFHGRSLEYWDCNDFAGVPHRWSSISPIDFCKQPTEFPWQVPATRSLLDRQLGIPVMLPRGPLGPSFRNEGKTLDPGVRLAITCDFCPRVSTMPVDNGLGVT